MNSCDALRGHYLSLSSATTAETFLVYFGTLELMIDREDWARHAYRIFDWVDNQVRCLRKRQVIDSFVDTHDAHDGTYWGIRTDVIDYRLPSALPADHVRTMELAEAPTRLKAMDPLLQGRLINWTCVVCDAAMCRDASERLPFPAGKPKMPYPVSPI